MQPPQLRPEKVPYTLPPTFCLMVRACSASSFSVVGGFSGSRPAFS
jgi:hypothetical protein